jgi:ribonucleoside-diphosphate reductase alpha chain
MAFEWANEDSRAFMSRGNGYLIGDETVETRVRDIADRAEELTGIKDLSDKIYDYAGRGFYSFSSPVWANFGRERGLPISCNGSYFGDSIEEMLETHAEIGIMTKHGAGTSGYYGAIRPRGTAVSAGGKADGPVHYMQLQESEIDIISQGSVRRGNFAGYLDLNHPDAEEFLELRETGSSIQQMSMGVCVSDAFMNAMITQGEKVKAGEMKIEDARELRLWMRVLRKRFETGYPYIFWSDNVNTQAAQVYVDKGLRIWASNLCTEIALPSNEKWSFVCCLSSINVAKWDEIKETDAVECLLFLLDAVMEEYIQKTAGMKFMERAHRFAVEHRAVGLGQLGWHTLLQSKMIPFESFEAMQLNAQIAKELDERTRKASQTLAALLGEPEVMKGYGMRNATRLSIAPTTSSSFILGQVSPSVEPLHSNYFIKDLAKGKFTWKNPKLAEVLESYAEEEIGYSTPVERQEEGKRIWLKNVWRSILEHGGSVQHLDFLTDNERAVFKCFGEISQMTIVNQAVQRQQFMDQAQSINLMIDPQTPLKEVNQLLIAAWQMGLKTLYYQRSTNPAQQLVRSLTHCAACEG